jgi:CheY-like chemotaxis protein
MASKQPSPILLVEDSTTDADLIEQALKIAGVPDPVVWVSTGESALAYLEGRSPYADRTANPLPCLILLDLNLSRLSGFSVLKHQREHRELRHVPTLVLTGSVNAADVDRAFELGAKGYVVKPIEFGQLAQNLRVKVNQCLGRKYS